MNAKDILKIINTTNFKRGTKYLKKHGLSSSVNKLRNLLFNSRIDLYTAWYEENKILDTELQKQKEYKFKFAPKFSIVVPLYKTPKKYLYKLVDSVINQTYSNWELCLSNGTGDNEIFENLVSKITKIDKRIKTISSKSKALKISANTNLALSIASGDYIVFADHDDELAPNALFECATELNKDNTIDIIYSDEDKIKENGKKHYFGNFKPDFNLDMLRSTNYFCHLVVMKHSLVKTIGGLREEFDGAQDYDFVLRAVEQAKNIKHISKILYHWRICKSSTAGNTEAKSYAFDAGRNALQEHYDRLKINAKAKDIYLGENRVCGIYKTEYRFKEEPLVSVIIPNKDHINDLEKCITSLLKIDNYPNKEIIIVENNSNKIETFDYYKKIKADNSSIKVVEYKTSEFNYSKINNYGVKHSNGKYILFLNNDTEIISKDCIKQLLCYCQREDVGAVGAKLLYPDNTIQHTGVIIGLCGVASHMFIKQPKDSFGYMGRAIMSQNLSAVTAACMLVKKHIFENVGMFDSEFAVAYNDIDLCLRIRKINKLIVINPFATLFHYESKSRGLETSSTKNYKRFLKEEKLFKEKWNIILKDGDPYFNPNLSKCSPDFIPGLTNSGTKQKK